MGLYRHYVGYIGIIWGLYRDFVGVIWGYRVIWGIVFWWLQMSVSGSCAGAEISV